MYNRYLSRADTTEDEFVEVDSTPVEEASGPAAETWGAGGGAVTAKNAQASLLETGRSLLRNLHMPELTFDDLLLIGIIFLLLRESDDDDIVIILAALFFTGFFKEPAHDLHT